MTKITKYLSLVKFAHTIFALPFALTAFCYALWERGFEVEGSVWVLLLQVVACMVLARNVAMAFNRWADRDIDSENPRTSDRDIPSGRVSSKEALWFVVLNGVGFVVVASTINPLTALLSPVALGVVMLYSLTKRFTWACHLVLGLSLGIAPSAAYIATTGGLSLPACILSLVVLTWCSGFDIIYALQDAEFDRERGLHSIPAKLSARGALAVSAMLHVVSIASLVWFASYCPQGWLLWIGCALFTAILLLEHILVTPTRQRNIGIAFGTLNGLASLSLALFVIAHLLIHHFK